MKEKIVGNVQQWRATRWDHQRTPPWLSSSTTTANSSHNRNTLPSLVLCFDGKSPTLPSYYRATDCVCRPSRSPRTPLSSNLFKNVHHLSITFPRRRRRTLADKKLGLGRRRRRGNCDGAKITLFVSCSKLVISWECPHPFHTDDGRSRRRARRVTWVVKFGVSH